MEHLGIKDASKLCLQVTLVEMLGTWKIARQCRAGHVENLHCQLQKVAKLAGFKIQKPL